MSCPTATPASKRHCNQQPSALMPPASQVTSVTSPPGTISHFFGSMFCTTSLFCHEFHNDDDHGDPNTLNTDGSPILSPPPPHISYSTDSLIHQASAPSSCSNP